MEIVHHIFFHSSQKELYSYLQSSTIKFDTSKLSPDGQLISFDISESHPLWRELMQLLIKFDNFKLYQGGDQYDTFFSEDEIRHAEWVTLNATFSQGYPQPENDWPFKQDPFISLTNVCPKCAIYEQINPIRVKKEPRMGKYSFMYLFWFTEFFVTNQVINEFKAIGAKGFEDWDVFISKKHDIAQTTRQLFIPEKTQPGLLDVDDLERKVCPVCGTVKFHSHLKGTMKYRRSCVNPDTDFIKTSEWFGTGHTSFNEIWASNRVANLILDKGWKGVRLKVVELV